jgi:hypothetical protein
MALEILVEKFGFEPNQQVVFDALKSPSYECVRTGIDLLATHRKDTILTILPSFEAIPSESLQRTIASIYAEQINLNYNAYFAANLGRFAYSKRLFRNLYLQYLIKQNAIICKEGVEVLATYYNQSSDSDKANTLLNFLNQWKLKSENKDFFESIDFKDFYTKIEAATKI